MKKFEIKWQDEDGVVSAFLLGKDYPETEDLIIARNCFESLLVKKGFSEEEIATVLKADPEA